MFVTYKCTGIEEEPFPIWGDDQINDLAPADVMEGWREPLMIMDEGAKWEVYIPPALATHVGADVTGDVLVCNLYVKKIAGPREYFGEQEDSGEEQEKQAGGGGGEEAEDEEEQKGNEDEDQEL